ncbi:MAG: phosphoribosylglycinamide formyltransferase [Nitrospina sp.]|nr:phosphoribosylglycinamide formyltransferase [Nitrospina sp.]
MPPKKFRLGVLVSGRGTNLQSILDAIGKGEVPAEVGVIISNKETAPALERGRQHGVESIFLNPKDFASREAYDRELVTLLNARDIDLVCLAGYMKILTAGFIRAFAGKIINIHPSLLPAFPGLDVQQKALDHGVKFAGCTVHFVEEEVDTGPIVLQAVVPVQDGDTTETLSARILEQEHQIYPRAIQLIAENRLRIQGRRVLIQEPE